MSLAHTHRPRRHVAALTLFAAAATAAAGELALPGGDAPTADWSVAERARPIAVRTVARSEFASAHVIRLQGGETPHYHDRHDLAVTVLRGESTLHFADRTVVLRTGDGAFIPRGSLHWAENTGDGASLVYAVFSPPFDGTDRRPATP